MVIGDLSCGNYSFVERSRRLKPERPQESVHQVDITSICYLADK